MYGDSAFSWEGSIYADTPNISMPSGGNSSEAASGYQIPQISLTPYSSAQKTNSGGQTVISSGGQRSAGATYPSTLTGKIESTPMLTGRTSTTKYIGGGTLPTYTKPTYEHPEYDYGRINYLAQQQAAPQYTRLQQGLYAGLGKIASTDNPQLQRMARKDLLSGYGGGVSDIAAKSAETGIQLYTPEYAGKLTEASMNYQGGLAKAQADFSALMAEYEKSFTQQTTESLTYTPQTSTTSLLYNDTLGSGKEKTLAEKLFGLPAGAVINPDYAPGSDWERRVKDQYGYK